MSGTASNPHHPGVRLVRGDELSAGGAVELVARLVAALTHAPTGSETLTAGSLELAAGASQPALCVRPDESVICVLSGEVLIRWGDHLEFSVPADAGDLLIIPAGLPHQLQSVTERCQIHLLEGKGI
jgi:uncharacterized RmlC-like cupin family protein